MSRTTERARASFYRSAGPVRIASVVMMLVVIGLLISRASDPNSWLWLTGPQGSNNAAVPVAATGDATTPDIVTPGPTDTDPEEREAIAEQFQAISDKTTSLGREEMPAYWRLFNWTEHQSLADLQRRADRSAVLNQFIQTPDEQRAKLFQLELNVRRVLSYDAPENSAGIKKVYEIWGWTTESKAWLYCVLTAHLPLGMPVGPDVNERVTFAGYFLKVQGYHAAGAGPRDKPLSAPVLIGRVAWKPSPALAKPNSDVSWIQGATMLLLLLAAVGLGIWMFIPRRSGGTRAAAKVGGSTASRGEIQEWLAHAERDSMNNGSTNTNARFQDH